MLRNPKKPLKRGFSLLELLAVITIMGILAVVIVPRIAGHALNGKVKVCYQYKGDLNNALEKFYFNSGAFATNFSQIENNDNYYPEAVPVCPVDGSAYVIDPTSHRVQGHAH